MQRSSLSMLFLFALCAAAAFVWLTSGELPTVVASHFAASGVANGFMPREYYVRFMLAMIIVLPALVAFLPGLSLKSPNVRINLPNREYWLEPGRRDDTIQVLCASMRRFAMLLLVFLSYVHWLVVRANLMTPPGLPKLWFIGGLGVFLLATLIWFAMFIGYFLNAPR
jgi:hypothetical protein